MMTTLDVDTEFEALTAAMFALPEVAPTDLPDWMTKDPMLPAEENYTPRHSTGRERCPWLDVEVPTGTLAVQDAAVASMLDQPVAFIKSPTAKHAHDGTALAMIDHAVVELRAALAGRGSLPRRRLRALLAKLEAMS